MAERDTPRYAYRIHRSQENYIANATSLIEAVLRRAKPETPARIALAGGSTPQPIYQQLARSDSVDWSNVQVFFGDERTVGPDHEDSNYRMAEESLFRVAGIPDENVFRIRGELDPEEAARLYEQQIKQVFNATGHEAPRFDLILLGMGADGHTASLFPNTPALDEYSRLVVANPVPQKDTIRITLTYPVLNAAHQVVFLVTGEDKAPALREVMFAGCNVPPAGRLEPDRGSVIWFLDAEAGSQL